MEKFNAFKAKFLRKSFASLPPVFWVVVFISPLPGYAQVPQDFQKVELLTGLKNSVNFEFAPDGRAFILDRYGKIVVYKPDTQTSVVAGELNVFHDLEDGLLAIAFDPDFEDNQYIYLHHSPAGVSVNRVSRFKLNGDQINMASEVVIIEWPTQRECCFHSAGDMDFDSQGNLYIATGDNSNHSQYGALNENFINRSAENTSSNTDDLRGKILRIKPRLDGSYSIPEGNLFPHGITGRPEIYVMGARNPFKIFVDKDHTDWLFWGEVGPDANVDGDAGPKGLDEINLTKEAGNYGWPYFSGKNLPYLNSYSDPKFYYDPNVPVNLSKWNTGAVDLPPAQPAWLDFFHQCYLAGPKYFFNPSIENPKKLPSFFDKAFFYYDFNTSKVWVVKTDDEGNILLNEELAPDKIKGAGFIDLKIGPDGQLYILEYGTGCCSTTAGTGKLVRIDYTGIDANNSPEVSINTDRHSGSLPLTVNFSSEGTFDVDGDELDYAWDFQSDGEIDSNEKNPSFTYIQEGVYDAQLRVTDAQGARGVKTVRIYAGNNAASFQFVYPPDGGMMSWGDEISYQVIVEDEEDGSTIDGTIDCEEINLIPSFGHLNHFHDGLTVNQCEGSFFLDPGSHDTQGEDDIFMVFNVNYTDAHGLTSYDQLLLHPKTMEAEFFDQQDMTQLVENSDNVGGRYSVRALSNNAYLSFAERNLYNIQEVSFRVASSAGGSIEIRSDSPGGALLGSVQVPETGGMENWKIITGTITDPGGKHDLYFVFKNQSGQSNFLNLNYIDFIGNGVSVDNTPAEVLAVEVVSSNKLRIRFNENIEKNSAEQLSNYHINNAVELISAELQDNKKIVVLNTSELGVNIPYELTISRLMNESGVISTEAIIAPFEFKDAIIRINSGGQAMLLEGVEWEASMLNTGGKSGSTDLREIHNTESDELYFSELYGNSFSYDIPVPKEGYYDVALHFAEIYHTTPGARVFNISVENDQFSISDYDIIERAGGAATAIIEEIKGIKVEDGFMTISFNATMDKAKVSALELTYGHAPSEEPTIKIIGLENGASVTQPFELIFEVKNWEVGNGTPHIHKIVDGISEGGVYSTDPITFDDLSPGTHTIELVLANADHTQTDIADQVEINIIEEESCVDVPFPAAWTEQVIGSQVDYRSVYIFSEDLDGDGLKDIVTGGWWYKNPGQADGVWEQKEIGAPLNNMSLIYDLDNDGDLDIFGTQGTYKSVEMAWAENDGQGNFTIHTNIPAGTSSYHENFMAGVAIGNFNDVENIQIAFVWNGAEPGSGISPVQMLTVPADPANTPWTIASISEDSYGEDISAGDIDGDGDLDIFQGGNWLRNDQGTWTTFLTGITLPSYFDRNALGDLDGDGRLDAVVSQIGNDQEMSWFEPPADPTQAWTRKTIGTDVDGGLSLDLVDIDGDGDLDVITAEWKNEHRLIAFENDLCNSGSWIKHILHPGGSMDHHDGAQAADIDNDGDLDIISIGWSTRVPRIYVNNSGASEKNRAPVVANPVPNQFATQEVLFSYTFAENVFTDADGDPLVFSATLADGTILPAWLSFDATTRNFSGTPTNSDVGTYSIRLHATDGNGGSTQDIFDLVLEDPDAGTVERLNAGGQGLTDSNGIAFEDDQYFSSSKTYSKGRDISNTADDALYTSERYGKNFTYNIPVTAGNYLVKLHFAEIYHTSAGKRVFSVNAEGQSFLSEFDIVAEAGFATAIIREKEISVSDGTLDLEFISTLDNAKISAIEVIGVELLGNRAPLVDAGDDQTIRLPDNSASFTASSNDPDGHIETYLWEQLSGPAAAIMSGEHTSTLTVAELVEGSYTFKVTVTDDQGASASDELSLEVLPEAGSNTPPVANAGSDQELTAGSEGTVAVSLDGSSSSDAEGNTLSYSWSVEDEEIATGVSPTVILGVGTHTIVLTVSDTEGGTHTDEVMVTINSGSANETAILRLNVGGNSFTATNGDFYAADNYFSAGKLYSNTSIEEIAHTNDDALYLTERSSSRNGGSFAYEIPVENGNFLVRLHFAEIYWKDPGKRIFSVNIGGGVMELSDFDIYAEVGALAAITKEYSTTVTDGILKIGFFGSVDRPKVSAIEVIGLGSTSNQPPQVDAGEDKTIMHPEANASLIATASDADGHIETYLWEQLSGPAAALMSGEHTSTLTVAELLEGSYTFKVTVTDDLGASASDELSLKVLPEASFTTAPVANAGPDQELTAGSEGTVAVSLDGSGSSDVDGEIIAYTWTLDGVEIANGLDPLISLAAGSHTITLTVTDNMEAVNTDEVVITINSSGTTTFEPIRLNAGGSAFTSLAGLVFAEDQYFSSSSSNYTKTGLSVNETNDDELYQSERYGGNFSYSIPVPSGTYKIRLYFAEVYFSASGKRVFNVNAENEALLSDFDIVAEVGFASALIKEGEVNVTDGMLDLDFVGLVNNAKLSAIEVMESTSGKMDSGSETARTTQLKAYPNTFTKFVDLEIRGADPQLYQISVYNLLGKLVHRSSFFPESENEIMHRIDLSNPSIEQGLYLVQVENRRKDYREVIKIVKIR